MMPGEYFNSRWPFVDDSSDHYSLFLCRHQGVPNTQLTIEDTDDARYYKRSIAEQNSFDLVRLFQCQTILSQ